ncbi:MAG: ABC transporter ATP-binding protein [Saccharofermentans sp.]|nr:ABC transporter ATP-binding protein [Saccharofermentans sp.]
MNNVVEISNVSFCYKGSEAGLLDNVSLSFEKGKTVLLCGASGCGKTTIIRLINGLIPHYYKGDLEGSIKVNGKETKDIELFDLAGVVGTVFQNPRSQFFATDTDGEIVFGAENIGLVPEEIKKRADEVTEMMNIGKLLGRSLFDLSGGEKQKIACASVSALMPDIILLDEPSSNLDWSAMEELKQAIVQWKKQGKTIIIAEHRLWYLTDLVDRVIYLENGNISKEWNGEEFRQLSEEEVTKLKLRPIALESDLIRKFRNRDNEGKTEDVQEDDAIILKDLYFSYSKKQNFINRKYSPKDKDILALNIPELRLPKGKVIGVVGHNGTGKSTFLRACCGLMKKCPVRIKIDGNEYTGKKLLKHCYMVMQDVNHQLFTDMVQSEVMLSMESEDTAKCDEILDKLGILEFKDKHPMALSGGQKQRVAIASALAAGADLLLLDEPTSGLDFAHMEKVGDMLRELARAGSTILVSTHDPELLDRSCDYVLGIDNGTVEFFN